MNANVAGRPLRHRAAGSQVYDRGLSALIHDQLHWFYVPQRVEYKLAVMVRRCLENKAPRYRVNCCTPVADVACRHRRSANLHRLIVPRYRRSTHGRRAFSVGVRPSGIHCLSNCVNRLWTTLSSSAHWRRSCLWDTIVHRAQPRCFVWNCAI